MAESRTVDRSRLVFRELRESDFGPIWTILEEQKWQFTWGELRSWNRCIHDSFTVMEYEGEYLGSINVIIMNDTHAFVGFYVMSADYRYQGLGKLLWNEGVRKAGNRSLILAAAHHNFDMYTNKKFRIEGTATMLKIWKCRMNVHEGADETVQVREVKKEDMKAVIDYDADIYQLVNRPGFMTDWVESEDTTSLVAKKDGKVVGFLVAAYYRDDIYKIGPVEADSLPIARRLIKEYTKLIPKEAVFTVDILDANQEAKDLFDKDAVFETDEPYYFICTGTDCPPNQENKIWLSSSPGAYRA